MADRITRRPSQDPSRSRPDAGSFEQRVKASIRRFEIAPLLRLLESRGYPRQQVRFQSNASDQAGGGLFHAIEFPERPGGTVLITVNVGLLGPNGLLPSYFMEVVERSDHAERFYDFVRFFDDWLISQYIAALHPEADPGLYPDYRQVRRHYLGMLGMRSTSTLRWLFQLQIPELTVRVRRAEFPESTAQHAFLTGSTPIDGTGILGQHYAFVRSGFQVEVYAEEYLNDAQAPWPEVMAERLYGRVLPVLRAYHIPLRFVLHILHHTSWLTVGRDPALGYERVMPEPEGSGDGGSGRPEYAHSILLYQGDTGDAGHTLRWAFRRYFGDFPVRVSRGERVWANLEEPTPGPPPFLVEVFVDLSNHAARHFLEALGRPMGLVVDRRIPTLSELRAVLEQRLARDLGGDPIPVRAICQVRPRAGGAEASATRVQTVTLFEGVPGLAGRRGRVRRSR